MSVAFGQHTTEPKTRLTVQYIRPGRILRRLLFKRKFEQMRCVNQNGKALTYDKGQVSLGKDARKRRMEGEIRGVNVSLVSNLIES